MIVQGNHVNRVGKKIVLTRYSNAKRQIFRTAQFMASFIGSDQVWWWVTHQLLKM